MIEIDYIRKERIEELEKDLYGVQFSIDCLQEELDTLLEREKDFKSELESLCSNEETDEQIQMQSMIGCN